MGVMMMIMVLMRGVGIMMTSRLVEGLWGRSSWEERSSVVRKIS